MQTACHGWDASEHDAYANSAALEKYGILDRVQTRGLGGTVFLSMALSAPSASLADEGGVPFWLSGQYGSLSAVPPQKGWALTAMPYLYEGGSQGRTFQRGRSLAAGIDGTTALTLLQLSYSPDATFLGGKPSFGLGFGVGGSWTRAAASVSALPIGSGAAISRKDSVGGLLDLYPIFTNSWSRGVHNWMVYVTGDIPARAYRSSRLSNFGIAHAAVDAGGGYTYFVTTVVTRLPS